MTFVIIIIILVLLFLAYLLWMGSLNFWQIANQNPNAFYNFIKNTDAWIIANDKPNTRCDGLYSTFVPSLNKKIIFYGVIGKFEASQTEYKVYFNKAMN